MLKTELLRIDEYYRNLSQAMKRIDATNIRILSCLSEIGPRNLLDVARRTRMPFSTVYNRVAKLEKTVGRVSHLVPTFSKLGLVNVLIVASAKPGYEDRLTRALKIPNYWRSITRCEGGFTHHSLQCIPYEHRATFHRYFAHVARSRIATDLKMFTVSDYLPKNLHFEHYDARKRNWKFPWDQWIQLLRRQKVTNQLEDPADYRRLTDRRDLVIVKELEKDGRKSFAELGKLLDVTLQAVKYRFDKMTRNGVCTQYSVDTFPYPTEISAMYDIMFDFTSTKSMNRFYSFLDQLFFVVGLKKVVKKNGLIVRVYIPETKISNMFSFFAEMARMRLVESYSALRLRLDTRQSQTISYELFDDEHGWVIDYNSWADQLKRIS